MSKGAWNDTAVHLLTFESIFVMSKGAWNDTAVHLLTLESIFVMSRGARNDNVYTYFEVNFCNV